MEEKTLEEKEKEKQEKANIRKKKTKHFFKIFGFSLLGVLGVAIIAVIGTWITGGFSTKPIAISSLTVEEGRLSDGSTAGLLVSGNEVLIMGDESYTTKISFAPEDANQLALTVKVKEGKNLLKSIPSVTAGKDFTLEFTTDENGKPIGGKIELQFINSNGLVSASLKLLVDSSLTDDMLTLNNANNIATNGDGKFLVAVTQQNSGEEFNFQLSSSNINAYVSKPGFVNFTNEFINGLRFKKSYLFTSNNKQLVFVGGMNDDYTNNVRTFGVLPISSGKDVKLYAYTHKTFIMQSAFNDAWINDIMSENLDNVDLVAFNAFVNNYFKYINTTEESNLFFEDKVNDSGLIELNKTQLKDSLKYIFVVNDASFIISDIEIESINISSEQKQFSVFSETAYNTSTISVNKENADDTSYFGIEIISKGNNQINNEVLKNRHKDLLIAPYIPSNDNYDSSKVVESYGVEYPKYLSINDNVYEYNDKYLEVRKVYNNGATSWTIRALSPNIDNTNLYLGIRLSYVSSSGEVEYVHALKHVKINYIESSINFYQQSYSIALNDKVTNLPNTTYKNEFVVTLDGKDATGELFMNKGQDFGDMEYKKLMWLIPAGNNYQDYIKVLDENALFSSYNGVTKNTIKLIDLEGKAINHLGGKNDYYIVGEGDSANIKALHALEGSIPLYAVVLQTTEANGLGEVCYVEEAVQGGGIERSYKVVSYTDKPLNINITKYLDAVYVYYQGENGLTLCSGVEDAMKMLPNSQASVFVSGMLLDATGTPYKEIRNENGDIEKVNLKEIEINDIKIAYKNYLLACGNEISFAIEKPELIHTVNSTNIDNYAGENYLTLTLNSNAIVFEDGFNLTVYSFDPEGNSTLPYVPGVKHISLVKILNNENV